MRSRDGNSEQQVWTSGRHLRRFKISSTEIDTRVFRAIEINIVDATWYIKRIFLIEISFREVLVWLVTTFFIHKINFWKAGGKVSIRIFLLFAINVARRRNF